MSFLFSLEGNKNTFNK